MYLFVYMNVSVSFSLFLIYYTPTVHFIFCLRVFHLPDVHTIAPRRVWKFFISSSVSPTEEKTHHFVVVIVDLHQSSSTHTDTQTDTKTHAHAQNTTENNHKRIAFNWIFYVVQLTRVHQNPIQIACYFWKKYMSDAHNFVPYVCACQTKSNRMFKCIQI